MVSKASLLPLCIEVLCEGGRALFGGCGDGLVSAERFPCIGRESIRPRGAVLASVGVWPSRMASLCYCVCAAKWAFHPRMQCETDAATLTAVGTVGPSCESDAYALIVSGAFNVPTAYH